MTDKSTTKWGLKEAAGAIAAAVAVGCLIAFCWTMLVGCAGGKAYVHYEHHSSIPDYYDKETADLAGFCVMVNLGAGDSKFKPWMQGCVNKEMGGAPTFGRDPSGELSVNFPVYVW